jgi:dCMP deaminase
MNLAKAVATRSKDPKHKVGVYIVDASNRVLSTGYNGMIPGRPESCSLWKSPTKHDHVLHAEINAIYGTNCDEERFQGAHAYSTHFPCMDCAEELVRVGVARLYYCVRLEKYKPSKVSHYLRVAGVTVIKMGGE